jgi:hypothetical protein
MRLTKLPSKLKRIRLALRLDQPAMAHALNQRVPGLKLRKQQIHNYELPHDHKNNMEPSAIVLALYADFANICPSLLMKDKLKLPAVIPAPKKHKERD